MLSPPHHPSWLTPLSVPQRDAAASRATRFTLSSGGLPVFSTAGWTRFVFSECIEAVHTLVPAHAVAFEVSGYGECEALLVLGAARMTEQPFTHNHIALLSPPLQGSRPPLPTPQRSNRVSSSPPPIPPPAFACVPPP